MSKHRFTTAVSTIIAAAMLAVTVLFMNGESLGIVAMHSSPPYADTLFSTDRVHTIDIVVNESDWAAMLANAQAEEYIMCDVVIDGDAVKNVAIRPKGNSSLSSIASSDSDRYSFKIEFDHYNGAQTFRGLDKLALNNIAQDNTYLKDYVSYQMMNAFGADAPLSSFIYITVNGEDWGLYLAVEGVEDSFAERVYGSDHGELYKPDTMDLNARFYVNGENAGRFDNGAGMMQMPEGFEMPEGWQIPAGVEMPEGFEVPEGQQLPEGFELPEGQQLPEGFELPEGQQLPNSQTAQMPNDESARAPDARVAQPPDAGGMQQNNNANRPGMNTGANPGFNGGMGGFGSNAAVALQYIDDNPDSYSAIFTNAVFNPTDSDKTRLISALKRLSDESSDLESAVDIDRTVRYFVVHNFVLNFDSYTGSMLHNYYLYEKDGVISMVAWDYNLAFGAFGGMGGFGNMGGTGVMAMVDTATSYVNFPVDTPTSGSYIESLPLLNRILGDDEYLQLYHELFGEFITGYFGSGDFTRMIDEAITLIKPFVEKDPTSFCTYEDFLAASAALREFCLLRAESVAAQLSGVIASTSEGQTASGNANFIDASNVEFDIMGSSMSGFNRGRNLTANSQRAR